jgi:uncharacterized protein YejL (UPF0352 family)
MKKLRSIQAELKCPKGSFNAFGKYKYRSAEQILESLKPVLQKHEATLTLTDDIIQVGNKLFLKATATLFTSEFKIDSNGFAELGEHKGMSSEQCTGTASSYARKYALNGLFLIDETESDPDSKDNSKTEKKLPAIDQKRFSAAVQAISKGEFTREKLESSFALTEGQTEMLNAL